jgi:hypothetical protein
VIDVRSVEFVKTVVLRDPAVSVLGLGRIPFLDGIDEGDA